MNLTLRLTTRYIPRHQLKDPEDLPFEMDVPKVRPTLIPAILDGPAIPGVKTVSMIYADGQFIGEDDLRFKFRRMFDAIHAGIRERAKRKRAACAMRAKRERERQIARQRENLESARRNLPLLVAGTLTRYRAGDYLADVMVDLARMYNGMPPRPRARRIVHPSPSLILVA